MTMAPNKKKNAIIKLKDEKENEGISSPEEMRKMVMDGAKLICPFHPSFGTLLVTSNQVIMQTKPWANENDNTNLNFLFPGVCTHPQFGPYKPPCKGVVTPLVWEDVGETIVQDKLTVLKMSKIKCLISGQYITIFHDGQTVTPTLTMANSADAVLGSASDFNCPPAVRDALQRNVNQLCKGEKTKCNIADPCVELETKMSKIMACIQARITINNVCYKGGDYGHNKQIGDRMNGFINCQAIYFPKCTEPPKKPVPVIEPLPAPDENFLEMMERITGLAGAALIIYLIISEGSRLFPPRNLVPIP